LPRGPHRGISWDCFWVNVFPAACYRGVRRLLAQPAIRVRAHWSQPIMTFPYRQAGKRARPIYRTDSAPCGELPKGRYGSRAVFQKRFHPAKISISFPGWCGCGFKILRPWLTHLPALRHELNRFQSHTSDSMTSKLPSPAYLGLRCARALCSAKIRLSIWSISSSTAGIILRKTSRCSRSHEARLP
jgi:hypothetical protein